jgi:hypothetical protein
MHKFSILVLTLLAAACQPKENTPVPENSFFNATLPSGIKQAWTAGDKVSVISLSSGLVATIDTFIAEESGGTTARFAGVYTGEETASLAVIYPAVEFVSEKIYESATLNGNDNGYFRVTKGTSYVIFAPQDKMKFLQSKNDDRSSLEGLSFLSEASSAKILFDGNITLKNRTSVLKLQLGTENLKEEDILRSVTLTVEEGTPFTTYKASLSLSNPGNRWATGGEARSTFDMLLGGIAASGEPLTLYFPIFQNNVDASLAGNEDRKFTVNAVTKGNVQYVMEKVIPAGDKSYEFRAGNEVCVTGTLEEKGNVPPPTPPEPEEVITKITKVSSAKVSALCIEGNYLYVGSAGTITVYDITNPKSPREAGSVIFPGSPRQMVPYNGKLFVSARETGVWIFSISNPKSPSLISRYDGIELSTGIDAAGDAIFVGERQTGVEFVDGRNPSDAQHIRVIKTNESQTVFYQNGYLYSGEWGAGKVTIFDAHDLSNIKWIRQIDLQGYGDGLWVTGNRLYASTGHHHRNQTPSTQNGDGHGVEIWDLTNPEDPRFISRCEFDIFYKSGSDWWLNRPSGDGKTLFCGDVYNGMYVVDITDETQPKIIYHWKPGSGNAVNSIALADGVAFMTVGNEGLYALECKRSKPSPRNRGVLPTNLDARYQYPTSASSHFRAWVPDQRGAVKGAVVYQDALFVGCGDAGLYTVKLNTSNEPYTYRRLDIPFAGGVAVRGDLLFVARGEAGLGVYRIGTDLNLTQVDLIKNGLNPTSPSSQFSYWVSVPNDNYVANGARSSGYQFLSIGGTAANPTFTFRHQYGLNLNYNRYISEKAAPNGLLPYATRSGLVWINLGVADNVPAPTVNENIKNALTEGCTLYKDGKILLAQHVSGSYPTQAYFGIIEPGGSSVIQTGSKNSSFEGIPRWESGDDVLVCNFVQRFVTKVNTANLAACKITFTENTEGYPEPGLFWNGKAIVPCGYQGLLIEK